MTTTKMLHVIVFGIQMAMVTGLHLAPPRDKTPSLCNKGFDAPFGTNCPDAKWVDAMVKKDPAPGKVIVNVGCNKGHDAIGWMQRWDMSPNEFWDTAKWVKRYAGLKGHKGKYVCGIDIPETMARKVSAAKSEGSVDSMALPTGVCVEAMDVNMQALRKVAEELGYNGTTPYGTFHLVHAAASDAPGEFDFPTGKIGAEGGRLRVDLTRQPVEVKTVDSMMDELGIEHVDILSIDTEGADAAVLRGATKTLKSVRYLEFEVHRDIKHSAWSNTTLQSVTTDLAKEGFHCYWAGNNAKLLSMSQCWDDKFERPMWGNAACVKENDPWAAVLQAFAA